jgi:hypothetical protein
VHPLTAAEALNESAFCGQNNLKLSVWVFVVERNQQQMRGHDIPGRPLDHVCVGDWHSLDDCALLVSENDLLGTDGRRGCKMMAHENRAGAFSYVGDGSGVLGHSHVRAAVQERIVRSWKEANMACFASLSAGCGVV